MASEVTGRESGVPLCGRHQAAGRLASSSTRAEDGAGRGRLGKGQREPWGVEADGKQVAVGVSGSLFISLQHACNMKKPR